ncbi:MAG: acyl-CoA dehydratase activase-related protein, partial [Ignavibacteria bacterium]
GIKIIGLGTTGSGRHIAALHALTKGVVNEIIAHAVAAAYFDPEVDTIFEIGGQDAKYTYLTNGVASDYAMNEACSAGTGSFLEEAAKESLSIDYRDIEKIALESDAPLNFNDQCAAFISSDIKTASHEGAEVKDIVAGLVYSVCLNYVNRVKGNRPVGKKVFMQGGVCYNKAVPFAMAILTGKDIIVPPEPGLMGAFGVALEIKNRIKLGFLEKGNFSFDVLINRKFDYTSEFICAGGAEKCDRKCSIALIEVDGKKYPFGGACSKYYNQRYNIHIKPAENNLVKLRQELVFKKYLLATLNNYNEEDSVTRVGISRSFLVNTLFPLYYNFFTELGFEVVLSDEKNIYASQKAQSSFCYPMELAHSSFEDLLKKKVDYIFLPHITQMDSHSENQYNRLCVFVQGECYAMKSTFRQEILERFHITESELDRKVISPVIDFTNGYDELEKVFVKVGRLLGKSSIQSKGAFRSAYDIQNQMYKEFQDIGYKFLKQLENEPDKFAMVLFGRSYNAFATEANLNIPHKFASKDIAIIPHDFLPKEIRTSYENMYWYSGNQILSSARFVKNHKQLFGVYITNYSCGPDSFIITYFRRIMGDKPSLTLELDSHSADVGIETRIDAAIDIIKNYRELKRTETTEVVSNTNEKKPLQVITEGGELFIIDSSQKRNPIKSKDVEILIPSMGHFSSDAFSAVFRSLGINCFPLPIPTFETVKQGRSYASCKECLPFILTTGSLLEFIEEHYSPGKKILFFMPHGYGPCRQGQYHIMIKNIIKDLGTENIGVLTMDDENAFADFGQDFFIKQWIALLIADVYHDIEATVSAIALDKEKSIKLLTEQWVDIIKALESGNQNFILDEIERVAGLLRQIKLSVPLTEAKVISLIGEIYVRREEFSRSELMKALLERSFVVKTAPITEYVYYSNYLLMNEIVGKQNLIDKTLLKVKDTYQRLIERKIKRIFAKSGLYKFEMVDLNKTMSYAKRLVSDKLIGEGILTVGLAMREILEESCGVVSIGPFNCIPSRLSEAILRKEMNLIGKYRTMGIDRDGFPEEITDLPFLYVESDGNTFPQITQSKIEIFMLQAEKLHNSLRKLPHRNHSIPKEL